MHVSEPTSTCIRVVFEYSFVWSPCTTCIAYPSILLLKMDAECVAEVDVVASIRSVPCVGPPPLFLEKSFSVDIICAGDGPRKNSGDLIDHRHVRLPVGRGN